MPGAGFCPEDGDFGGNAGSGQLFHVVVAHHSISYNDNFQHVLLPAIALFHFAYDVLTGQVTEHQLICVGAQWLPVTDQGFVMAAQTFVTKQQGGLQNGHPQSPDADKYRQTGR